MAQTYTYHPSFNEPASSSAPEQNAPPHQFTYHPSVDSSPAAPEPPPESAAFAPYPAPELNVPARQFTYYPSFDPPPAAPEPQPPEPAAYYRYDAGNAGWLTSALRACSSACSPVCYNMPNVPADCLPAFYVALPCFERCQLLTLGFRPIRRMRRCLL